MSSNVAKIVIEWNVKDFVSFSKFDENNAIYTGLSNICIFAKNNDDSPHATRRATIRKHKGS